MNINFNINFGNPSGRGSLSQLRAHLLGPSIAALAAFAFCAAATACGDDAAPAASAGGAAGQSPGGTGGTPASGGAAGSVAQGGNATAGAGGSAKAGAGGTNAAGSSGAGGGGASGTAGAGGLGGNPQPVVLKLSETGHDRFFAVTFDAAGSAYAAGQISDTTEANADVASIVVKLTPEGKVDPTFGTGGVARHNLIVGAGGELPRNIVVQPDGKLIIGATIDHLGGDPRDRDIAVYRLLPTGELDGSFGKGGIAVLDLSTGEAVSAEAFSADEQWGLALAPNGDVLVSGAKKSATSSDIDHTVVRLKSDGSLDPTFATGGVFSVDVAKQGADPRTVILLPDGGIVAGGYSDNAAGVAHPLLFKLTADGKLDPSFGTGGVFADTVLPHTTEVYGVALQGDKLVTAGYGKAAEGDKLDWVSLRLTANGKLDTTYGANGVVKVDAAGFNDNGRGLVILPDGRVLLLGGGRSDASTADAMVAVLSKDGAPDATFGEGGKRIYDLGGTGDQFWQGALSPDQKRVVVVGLKGSSATNDDAAYLMLSFP